MCISPDEAFFCFKTKSIDNFLFLEKNMLWVLIRSASMRYMFSSSNKRGWSGVATVGCILRHRGAPLILTYSLARPAILVAVLVAGKGTGGMLFFLLFLHFHSCSSFFPIPLFYLLYYLFYLCSPFLWETIQDDPQRLMCRQTPSQSISQSRNKKNIIWIPPSYL